MRVNQKTTEELSSYSTQLMSEIQHLALELKKSKVTGVKSHIKHSSKGKKFVCSSYVRSLNDGLTEVNTEKHKLFVDLYLSFKIACGGVSIHEKEVSIGNERRCDILLKMLKDKKICIECQLSKIPREEIHDRTFYYLHRGYGVIWVLDSSYAQHQYVFKDLIKRCNHLGYETDITYRGLRMYTFEIINKENKNK